MREIYRRQVGLLLDVLPIVAKHKVFALKGGTAINFFLRNMPRLSVDIDLQYVLLNNREEALQDIKQNMEEIGNEISQNMRGVNIQLHGQTSSMQIEHNSIAIKIEPNTVLRGTLIPTVQMELCSAVSKTYGRAISINCVSKAELYAGKLCAALDRQHPRDLFDILLLKKEDQFDRKIIDAFLVYLISHGRPIHELLNPNKNDIEALYNNQFEGMAQSDISLEELQVIQDSLAHDILDQLNQEDRKFLLGFKKGQPDWNLLSYPQAQHLPAVKWKQLNLEKMDEDKRQQFITHLDEVLNKTKDQKGAAMTEKTETLNPQQQLAEEIITELVNKGLVNEKRGKELQEKMASGRLKQEDWALMLELNMEKTD